MKTSIFKPILIGGAMLLAVNAEAQFVKDRKDYADGIVTTTSENALKGDEYFAEGIVEDWTDMLRDFENTDSNKETEKAIVDELKTKMVKVMTRNGVEIELPQMIDENGIDLFLLTVDGIYVYMAIDSPSYYQDPDKDVIKWIRYFAFSKRKRTEVLFKRYAEWQERMKQCFRFYGVPEDLTELCLIESGCTVDPISIAGARGMWQLMPATARHYGLTVNDYIDERSNPDLSLVAAARNLKDCYSKLGDWTLAAAAYNCGSGNVQKAIKKGNKEWRGLSSFLPKETQQYVPSLLAVHYVWTYRKELGFEN